MSLGKVLVLGGTGRIGKEVIARLQQGGHCSGIVAASHNPDKAGYLKVSERVKSQEVSGCASASMNTDY
jgi:uncharacterized protein YbjT (DUF2867 family)